MPLGWWVGSLIFDVVFLGFDLVAISKPMGWIFAGIMFVCAIWNGYQAGKMLRRRRLTPDRDPHFWTRDA